MTMVTSRSCPHSCTFCSVHLVMGRTFRPHGPEHVIEEIELLVREYGTDFIVFQDDAFTILPERVEDICERILQRKLRFHWACFSRVDDLSERLARTMARAGCRQITFGVESGNEEALRGMRKRTTVDAARKAIALCNVLGIRSLASFVIGFPFDTRRTIQETIDFACGLSPIVATFSPLIPFPGTEYFDMLERPPKDLDGWQQFVAVGRPPVSFVAGMSPRDLQQTALRGHLRFYLRPKQVLRIASSASSLGELKAYGKGGLGLLNQWLSSRT